MNQREKYAVLLFVVGFGIPFVGGMIWGLGFTLFDSFTIGSAIVWVPALIYIGYRGLLRGINLIRK